MSPLMEDKAIVKVRQDLSVYLKKTEKPQSQVARGSGVSGAVISQFLSSSYAGDNSKVANKIKAFLDRELRTGKRVKKTSDFVETSVAKRIFAAADFCYSGKIGIAYGNSGIGKTMALMELVRQDPTILLIQVAPGYSAFNILSELCAILGVECKHTLSDMLHNCSAKLRESGRLLVIDEAEYLKIMSLDMMRRLHDFSGIGILLVGTPRLNFQFRDNPNFKQIDNRVRLRVKLGNVTLEDAKDIIAAQVPECVKVADLLFELSKGDARKLESLLEMVLQLVDVNGIEISDEVCAAAARFLGDGG